MNLPISMNDESSLMVGIRSMGLSFDSIIGYQDLEGQLRSIVDDQYVYNMLSIANDRFKTNTERIRRFQVNISRIFSNTTNKEDREARKQRKRAEGLALQQSLRGAVDNEKSHNEADETAVQDLWN
jgi:tRNA wybutosine-synthesizing protein 3